MTHDIPGTNNEFFRNWATDYPEARRGVHVPLSFIDINDGYLSDATLFSQIMYWHEPSKKTGKTRLRVRHDGRLWLAKNHSDWYAECRIKARTVRRSLERIKKRGLIEYELHGFKGNQTPFIRINEANFEKAMRKWINKNVANPIITGAVASDDPSQNEGDTPLSLKDSPLDNMSTPPGQSGQLPWTERTAYLDKVDSPNTETPTQNTTENTTENTAFLLNPYTKPSNQAPLGHFAEDKKPVHEVNAKPRQQNQQEGLAGYLAEIAKKKGLTEKQFENLNRVMEMRNPKAPSSFIKVGNPVELWEKDSLFRTWMQERIDYIKKNNKHVTRTQVIRKVQDRMVMDNKYGWLKWRENWLNTQNALVVEEKLEDLFDPATRAFLREGFANANRRSTPPPTDG